MSLRLEHITVKAPARPILKDVSFSLGPGHALALIGPSGSGKTTLVKVVLGLLENFNVAGSIYHGGQCIQSNNALLVPIAERRFGYIPQNLALWPHLSVWDCVKLSQKFAAKKRIPPEEGWLPELTERCGLTHLLKAFPCTLSGGEKQRLALARALAAKPQLLVLDEPFTALDAGAKKSLIALLKDLHKRLSFSVIFISHDLNEVRAIGQEIMVLEMGALTWYGEQSKLCNEIFTAQWNPLASIS